MKNYCIFFPAALFLLRAALSIKLHFSRNKQGQRERLTTDEFLAKDAKRIVSPDIDLDACRSSE